MCQCDIDIGVIFKWHIYGLHVCVYAPVYVYMIICKRSNMFIPVTFVDLT